MKSKYTVFLVVILSIPLLTCKPKVKQSDMNIIYLHHSTGGVIWNAKKASLFTKVVKRISPKFAVMVTSQAELPKFFDKYNEEHKKNYLIKEVTFPKKRPYGWHNYPYDYYNIWVKNAGQKLFMEEPTLEILTREYQVIIFKHCFPVCNIQPDIDTADIDSDIKTISNYKMQYLALREKLHEFPETKFILFTGATQVMANMSKEEARRSQEFFNWVINEWDQPDDNIYLWDLYNLQTEGGLYFKDEFAVSTSDSHPNGRFARKAVKLLFNRIIDVIENDGNKTNLKGEIL